MGKRNKFQYSQLSKRRGKGYRFDANDDPCTEFYLETAKTFRKISQDEEQEIIIRIKNGDPDSERLKDTLMKSHQAFIIMFAQRNCPNKSDVFMDLIQEGNYGMCVALDRFNPSKNVKFLSYANAWIVKYMYKFLQDNELIKRQNRSKTWNLDTKIRDEYVRKYGCEPTCEEMMLIFNEIGVSIKNPIDLQEMKIISIDQPLAPNKGSDDDDDDSNTTEYGETDDIIERIDQEDKRARLRGIMDKVLDADEYMAIGMKFGFDGMDEYSANEIADFLGITQYKVKSVITDAIDKLGAYRKELED